MSDRIAGLIDTNILIHALTTDRESQECRAFLRRVRDGEQPVVLTALVVFELTYALGRYKKQMGRAEIGDYLLSVLALPSVRVDDDYLVRAVRAWAAHPELGFVDAYLGVRAQRDRVPVYTKNVRHFALFDIDVPNPLFQEDDLG